MDHAIVLTDGGLIFFTDERDLDQLAEALASRGFIKITGEQTRSDGTNRRTIDKPTVIFREAIVSLN